MLKSEKLNQTAGILSRARINLGMNCLKMSWKNFCWYTKKNIIFSFQAVPPHLRPARLPWMGIPIDLISWPLLTSILPAKVQHWPGFEPQNSVGNFFYFPHLEVILPVFSSSTSKTIILPCHCEPPAIFLPADRPRF